MIIGMLLMPKYYPACGSVQNTFSIDTSTKRARGFNKESPRLQQREPEARSRARFHAVVRLIDELLGRSDRSFH